MKKTILLLALMLTFNTAQAGEIKYINCIPYKEYKKEIKLKNTSNNTFEIMKDVTVTKNNYQFKLIAKKIGVPTEYIITNNSKTDLTLIGVISAKKYYNRDMNREHAKRIVPIAKACFTTWYFYVPYVNLIPAVMSDVEKAKFVRDFPKNKIIKSGESLRILCIEVEKNSRLQIILNNDIFEF
jgi:hypothetical protein